MPLTDKRRTRGGKTIQGEVLFTEGAKTTILFFKIRKKTHLRHFSGETVLRLPDAFKPPDPPQAFQADASSRPSLLLPLADKRRPRARGKTIQGKVLLTEGTKTTIFFSKIRKKNASSPLFRRNSPRRSTEGLLFRTSSSLPTHRKPSRRTLPADLGTVARRQETNARRQNHPRRSSLHGGCQDHHFFLQNTKKKRIFATFPEKQSYVLRTSSSLPTHRKPSRRTLPADLGTVAARRQRTRGGKTIQGKGGCQDHHLLTEGAKTTASLLFSKIRQKKFFSPKYEKKHLRHVSGETVLRLPDVFKPPDPPQAFQADASSRPRCCCRSQMRDDREQEASPLQATTPTSRDLASFPSRRFAKANTTSFPCVR